MDTSHQTVKFKKDGFSETMNLEYVLHVGDDTEDDLRRTPVRKWT